MSFTGNENHDIPLEEASEWTKNFRDTVSATDTIGHYFGKGAIQDILDQDTCVGIRIYYALDNSGKKHLIITGVDANQNDLYEGKLAERSAPCPSMCSTLNPLNS